MRKGRTFAAYLHLSHPTGEKSASTVQEILTAVLEREPDWRLLPAKTPAKVRQLLRHCLVGQVQISAWRTLTFTN